MGKSALDNKHPLNLGMCGYHGQPVSNKAIDQSDVIIALGARFSNRHTINLDTYPGHKKLIHIDIDPAEIGKNVETLLPIVGDIKQILDKLLGIVKKADRSEWLKTLEDISAKTKGPDIPESILTETAVLRIMNEYIEYPIVTTDVGRHQMFAAHEIPVNSGRDFISSGGLGTMGFGLPSAVGAALGRPDKQVVVVNGDGGFMMNSQEIVVAAELGLNIIVFLMNDSKLGMITMLQDEFYQSGFDISPLRADIDFVKLAESMGGRGHSVSTQDELRELLAKGKFTKAFTW